MARSKRPAKRLSREDRQASLIRATYDCIARNGLDGTTIRDVAAYAGVTFGLIRHHFANKDELIQATYVATTAEMTRHAQIAADAAGPDPARQLSAFVATSLRAPFASPDYLSFWSSFVGKILFDPHLRQLHRDGFWDLRHRLTSLVRQVLAQAGHPTDAAAVDRAVLKVNAIMDGLWIEASLGVETVAGEDLVSAGIDAVGAVLGVTMPPAPALPSDPVG